MSSSPALLALLVVFVVGAMLFALGTYMVRREAQAQTPVAESVVVLVTSPVDFHVRLDQIERLAMVGQPWCVEQLQREYLNDPDERLRNAAEDALMVIAARGA